MKIIKVKASKDYQITVSNGFDYFQQNVMPIITGDTVAVITDSNVEPLYFEQLKSLLKDKKVFKYVIEAGEQSKNAENYVKIVNAFAKLNLSRKATVIALGGGVVGDLSAFVASTYMRGVKYVAIPTTLLSMVDSSIGGKTGIDLDAGKNLIGTFFQPDAVYINTQFIKTLPEREIISGFGEIMKYAFIDSRITTNDLKSIDYFNLIVKSLEIKRDIVEEDEKESGKRMLLNFGHTVGHALEKLYNYELSHGECVIKGMYYSLNASYKLGYLEKSEYQKAVDFLKLSGVTVANDFTKEEILSVIKSDKKADGDSVNFVFTKGFGRAFIEKIKFVKVMENIL